MVVVSAHATPIAKFACVAAGCAVLAASAGTSSPAATPPPRGLTATAAGAAFAKSPVGGEMPVMSVRGLAPGHGTSGTVTVRNPTARSRLFWLSQADLADQIGPGGGRLSDALQLSVLDMSTLSSPAALYRGPATTIGARPLGFLAPGASRTYSFTATLPDSQGPPSAPGSNPYRGSSTALTFAWRAIEGLPAVRSAPGAMPSPRSTAVARPRGDTRPPKLRVSVQGRQPLLQARALDFDVACGERGRQKVTAVIRAGSGRWNVTVADGATRAGRRSLRLALPPAAYTAIRSSLLGGRDASVSLSVRARDRAGNRSAMRRSIRLQGG